ncbi:hypothetical protein SDC9_98177 [bioreactor metagenome]|uniref:Uncharacterized protein n=1 Tax=bioreactor metagenome TaxID=1076179 RepID=A0A645AFE2_9ZZZZ
MIIKAGFEVIFADYPIFILGQSARRTALHTRLAQNAQILLNHAVGRKDGGSENGYKPHPGSEFGGQQTLVEAYRPQPCVFRGHDMAERRLRPVLQQSEAGKSVAGKKERRMALAVQIADQIERHAVQKPVGRVIGLLMQVGGGRLNDGKRHGYSRYDDGPCGLPKPLGPEIGRDLVHFVPALDRGETNDVTARVQTVLFNFFF